MKYTQQGTAEDRNTCDSPLTPAGFRGLRDSGVRCIHGGRNRNRGFMSKALPEAAVSYKV